MTQNKILLTLLLSIVSIGVITAENGINSPYSRFGLGILSDQSFGINRQMGGLGYALRDKSYINLLNPASLSAADTITMLLDAGFSLQHGNFSENGKKINATNASFDYIAMEFRLRKGLGAAIGFLPFSNVGYSFNEKQDYYYPEESGGDFTVTSTYYGSGGLSQPFVALGWSPLPRLSVGLLASYLFGDLTHSISNSYSDANIRSRARYYSLSVADYKLDLGLQYSGKISSKHSYVIGAVYSLGHKMNVDAQYINQVLSNGSLQSADTLSLDNGFHLPHTFGLGATVTLSGKWTLGADYTLQKWSSSTFFGEGKGVDRSKISIGAEYFANELTRNFFKRIHYRAGFYYSQPYTEIDGSKGSHEYGVSAGFSIPIVNNYNNQSLLNISGQYVRVEPKSSGMISESYLRLNVGITFNESWFMKWKLK